MFVNFDFYITLNKFKAIKMIMVNKIRDAETSSA